MNIDTKFSNKERLHLKRDFSAVYREGKRSLSRLFKVIIRRNELPYSRLGINIPKKRVVTAVERNRWKRLIREILRRNKLDIGVGIDIIVIPLFSPDKLKLQDVEGDLLNTIKRCKKRLNEISDNYTDKII